MGDTVQLNTQTVHINSVHTGVIEQCQAQKILTGSVYRVCSVDNESDTQDIQAGVELCQAQTKLG